MILLPGVRTHGMRPQVFHAIYTQDIVWKKYGDDYDAVLEDDHVHVEYQPHKSYSVGSK